MTSGQRISKIWYGLLTPNNNKIIDKQQLQLKFMGNQLKLALQKLTGVVGRWLVCLMKVLPSVLPLRFLFHHHFLFLSQFFGLFGPSSIPPSVTLHPPSSLPPWFWQGSIWLLQEGKSGVYSAWRGSVAACSLVCVCVCVSVFWGGPARDILPSSPRVLSFLLPFSPFLPPYIPFLLPFLPPSLWFFCLYSYVHSNETSMHFTPSPTPSFNLWTVKGSEKQFSYSAS